MVLHPAQWRDCGYHDIQSPPQRYRVIDEDALCVLTGCGSREILRRRHERWIQEELEKGQFERQAQWSEEVAVGPDSFKAHILQLKSGF